jgi:hypothetical protein
VNSTSRPVPVAIGAATAGRPGTPLDALFPAGDLDSGGIRVGAKVAVTVHPAGAHVLPAG